MASNQYKPLPHGPCIECHQDGIALAKCDVCKNTFYMCEPCIYAEVDVKYVYSFEPSLFICSEGCRKQKN